MLQDFIDEIVGKGSSTERGDAVRQLIEKCGYAAAALTILPIPGSEILAVMPLHVGMVGGIGRLYGQEITSDSASDLLMKIGATVGLSLVGSRLATTAAKVILPGLGGLISAPFIYASTLAIGAVARAYFEQDGQLSEADMRRVYKNAQRTAKQGFDPSKMRREDARDMAKQAASAQPGQAAAESVDPIDRLKKLKSLLEKGLIEESEYQATKKRILSEL